MKWVDVTGPPGVGKSTLCDADWPPDAIERDMHAPPLEWAEFLQCAFDLLDSVRPHASFRACESMLFRSFRKMAAVHRQRDDRVYVQTGFAQRGLGLGWRLEALGKDVEQVADYYRLMPVSLGVVLLTADVETIQRRNVERGKDRAFMVPFMERTMEIAARTLRERGVRMIDLDMTRPPEENRMALKEFACH